MKNNQVSHQAVCAFMIFLGFEESAVQELFPPTEFDLTTVTLTMIAVRINRTYVETEQMYAQFLRAVFAPENLHELREKMSSE